jgi:hypothetical protein
MNLPNWLPQRVFPFGANSREQTELLSRVQSRLAEARGGWEVLHLWGEVFTTRKAGGAHSFPDSYVSRQKHKAEPSRVRQRGIELMPFKLKDYIKMLNIPSEGRRNDKEILSPSREVRVKTTFSPAYWLRPPSLLKSQNPCKTTAKFSRIQI